MTLETIRFGVGITGGVHASTWSVIYNETAKGKSEIYLANRKLGGELKASMHDSGQWHIAFSNEMFEKRVKGVIPNLDKRFIDTWPKPPEVETGLVLAFKIVTPWVAVNSTNPVKKSTKVHWINPPPDDKCVTTYILISTPSARIADWPGKNQGTSLVHSIVMRNNEVLWIVTDITDCPDLSKSGPAKGHFFKGASKEDLENTDDLHILVFGDGPNGERAIYETVIKQE